MADLIVVEATIEGIISLGSKEGIDYYGVRDGWSDGTIEGISLGSEEIIAEGVRDGWSDGTIEGTSLGSEEGIDDGVRDGWSDGTVEGIF